tara:strand:+ start:3341 stop:4186 length:846 start_codon:yes stop_codon:yes gene_type:complete
MTNRNNEDRFAAPPPDSSPAPVAQSQQLEFTVPTHFVDLPSQGNFYPEDSPLCGVESVEMRYMTAKDEDILTNKSLIKNGTVLDRLLQNLLVDKSFKPQDFLVGDKSALIVQARINGYGSDYEVKVACPSCGTIDDYQFDLEQAYSQKVLDFDNLVVTKTNSNTFITTVPFSKAEVEIRLLTGKDERDIANTNRMRTKNKLSELSLTEQMLFYIVSVNGNSDRSYVNSFVDNMPALDAKHLRATYKEINPTVELEQNFDCSACGYNQVLEVPFTSEFFWPK